ncbi:MAG: hypothetical protein GX416_10590 [Bacteroidales bacterium]|nr:hypothetical protein [Bacteroidales bacterium]
MEKKLLAAGFRGFVTIGQLQENISVVPDTKGVYLLLKSEETGNPEFLPKGSGGHFKGNNPNVTIEELKKNWVENADILYIGKAGGERQGSNLRKRLNQLIRFGQGGNVGHWGGRYIWQLKDSEHLLVCWKELSNDNPREIEKSMIDQFKSEHNNSRPFANLQG